MTSPTRHAGNRPAPVLVIDHHREVYKSILQGADDTKITLDNASTIREGLTLLNGGGYDVVLVRDMLPDGAACYFIQELLSGSPPPEIIVYTNQGDLDQAEHALKSGVWEYHIDQAPERTLPELLLRALRYRQSKVQENGGERKIVCQEFSRHGIIGRSKEIQNCLNLVARIAPSEGNVLITGESGTGKELFATAIHNLSPRAQKRMIIVDCAALPPTLVESILFGHAKGSFTGADKAQEGLIRQADGGTLFLDEIGELPLEIQKKFLRVIQERRYRPVGGNVEITSNFRLIAATNKDLQTMAEQGTFREDLLYRLRTFQLELPPLRKRAADITELAYYYRDHYCKCCKIKKKQFSSDYLTFLTQYEWPGNVRELFQTIEHSLNEAQDSSTLYPNQLPVRIRLQVTRRKLEKAGVVPHHQEGSGNGPENNPMAMESLREARERIMAIEEKKYLERLLTLTGGNVKQCCEIAELSRSRFYDLLKKYQIRK